MGIEEESVDALQINALYRMGEKDKNRKYPRPVCVQFANEINKDTAMSKIKKSKEKKSCRSELPVTNRNKFEKHGRNSSKYKRNIKQRILKLS